MVCRIHSNPHKTVWLPIYLHLRYTTIREGTMAHRCAQKNCRPHPTSRTIQIPFSQTLQKLLILIL